MWKMIGLGCLVSLLLFLFLPLFSAEDSEKRSQRIKQ
jgi:hypothetical protein